ncbi:MAG: CocE/NonD family hydrolase [Planctomycetaceae bacterium]|jgi:predicted acyl esterase
MNNPLASRSRSVGACRCAAFRCAAFRCGARWLGLLLVAASLPAGLFTPRAVAQTTTAAAPQLNAAGLPPLELPGVREEHVMIPMRDGIRLSAYLYFPEGQGPWPVLFEQRYADLKGAGTRQAFARLARGGYVVAGVNFRGAGLSEGTWVGYRALGWGERKDGYDACEWLGTQPWSTGKVGTFGSSQAGFAQNFLAITRPPHLTAQYMIDTGLSLYHEGYRIGGITRPKRFQTMGQVCRVPAHNDALMAEWFEHPTFDDYWKQEDCSLHFDQMNVPCFTIGSWYDFMNQGSVASYVGRQHLAGPNSKGRQQLLIGPWLHGGLQGKNNAKVNELEYPDNAKFDGEQHLLRWMDHHLKGVDNGINRDPTVRYYVLGALGEAGAPGNEWRTASDFPIPHRIDSYYLQSEGHLTTTPPQAEQGATAFKADFANPNRMTTTVAFPGATDAQKFEAQPEVRTFTTEPLAAPVEWTGQVKAELYVTSTAPDTDFIVRVCDVYPDGRSVVLIDYVRRARYREGFEKEVFMKPGQIYPVAFDVGWISQIFNKGHRIRVTVCSTGPEFYEPHPNTADKLGLKIPETGTVAHNTVEHNLKYASRVLAPVIPATTAK